MRKLVQILLILLLFPLLMQGREYLDLRTGQGAVWEKNKQVISTAVIYRSTDQFGDSITLSGRIHLPKQGRAERIILCPHYSITGQSECPSEGGAWEASRLADKRYILVMPDYIGYGISRERIHPYLDNRLTVRNTLDMLQAVQRYLDATGLSPMSDSIVIAGFSQGAAVAVGTLMEIERTNVVPVKKCYASSGPYDVATIFDLNVARNYIGMAYVAPAFVIGTSEAYGLQVHVDSLFTPWMLERYKYALSGEHGIVESAIRLGRGKMTKYLTEAGLDKTRGEQAKLYEGYLRSSIVHIYDGDTIMSDWCPKTPLYLMHSVDDDLVLYECAENLRTMFVRNGATCVEYDFGAYGGHLRSMLRFFRLIKKELGI